MKKIVIALHGLKPVKFDDMKVFKESYSKNLNKELISFDYFYNNNLEDIKIENVLKKVESEIIKHKNDEVTLFGYSLGCLISIIEANKYPNVRNLVLLTPPLDVKEDVLISGINEFNKRAKIKYGIDYEKLVNDVNFQEENLINLYPDHLLTLFKDLQKKALTEIKQLKGKRVIILNATNDEVINVEKSRIIASEISKNNILMQKDINSGHFFNKFKPENFNLLVEELNKF